jgi:hypothetical protein
MTTSYQITARDTGHCLGIYEGATPADAVEELHRDAGYAGSGEAAAALEMTVEALLAQLDVRETRVASDDDVAHIVDLMISDDCAALIADRDDVTEDNACRELLASCTEADYVSCGWSDRAIIWQMRNAASVSQIGGFATDADTIDRVRDAYVTQLVADAASEADVEAMIADLEVAS